MRYIIVLALLTIGLNVFGQVNRIQSNLIQVSGIIHDADSNNVVPYVTISNSGNKLVYSANYQGYFSFIAKPGDTLTFTAIGYKPQTAVVPENNTDNKHTLMIKMKSEIYVIQAVRVYPWATVEEFTHNFLNMKIADDDLEIARKNLLPQNLRNASLTLPLDAGEIANMNNRFEHNRAVNKNMVQTNPLLNPFAWGKLIQSIMNGDKNRKEN
ncbi:carboxypeptidase-like regulatory domain-containing protein [Pedobacter flavus]|uniref:Carboxypeptidase-like regulatory domain-containing protein n=1 Tax=Pedobacter flavus TaxID=3113906 RepID=A0ABU7GZC5_9SPHI|nr:carboxypeptidase-like regulatory domain-containing protein [Pedobacter sp. VNH31]MEE1884435.1 carboxypeptidase-like regulatory domain-containing protein [Pedobacter sp. VNH31]